MVFSSRHTRKLFIGGTIAQMCDGAEERYARATEYCAQEPGSPIDTPVSRLSQHLKKNEATPEPHDPPDLTAYPRLASESGSRTIGHVEEHQE